MRNLVTGGLLSTTAPTKQIIGIAFIALFAMVGMMVRRDYDEMNSIADGNSKNSNSI